jgi:hypothetical protein
MKRSYESIEIVGADWEGVSISEVFGRTAACPEFSSGCAPTTTLRMSAGQQVEDWNKWNGP